MANKKDSNKNGKQSKSSTNPSSSKKKISKPSVKEGTTPKKVKKETSKAKKIAKIVFFSLLFLFSALFVVGLGYVFAVINSTAPLDINAVKSLSQATALYDRNGTFMDTVHSDIDRQVVDSSKIPQTLKDAYVSIEDERFYSHSGIDVRRILGSVATDVIKVFKGERGFHGGSTITQQLLKNTVLTNEDFIIERKIKEIYLAINLDGQLDKDEILTMYLNTIPLGGITYGVEAASNLYFGKSVNELNLIECAYLAGLTQAPHTYSAYNPNNQADPSVYINRTKTVLRKMYDLNKITEDEFNAAIADLDNGKLEFKQKNISYTLDYEWYINPTIKEVKKDLKEKYKYTDEEVNKLLANGGLKIYTYMDKELQDYSQQVLDETTAANVGLKETYVDGTNTPAFQGAVTVVDYRTGEVLALIGGRGEQGANSLNRAYTDLKSIGSSTKPLTVYGPAIEEKLFTAASTLDDAPFEIDGNTVNNVDKTHYGNITLRESIKESKNITTVKTQLALGNTLSRKYGEKLGITYSKQSEGYSAMALGEFHNAADNRDGANTYILASAFGVFGNGGVYTEPKLYSRVEDASGKVLLETETETNRVFSEQTAWITYDLLKGSQSYSGKGASLGAMPVAGKTGTTTDAKSYWFSGLTPHLSASVWLGYDTPKAMKGSSNAAATVWGKIMAKASQGQSTTDITMPKDIVKIAVCKDSGHLPTELCAQDPRGNRVYEEYFIKGTEPTGYCENHVAVEINSSNNKLATANTPSNLRVTKIFVKKANPIAGTADAQYMVPTESDDALPPSVLPPTDDEDEDKDDENSGGGTNPNPDEDQGTKPSE